MPEVQEVFRMATQKVRQDPGALDRQVTKQRKAARNRRVGVFAMVLVLVAAIVGAYAFTHGETRTVPGSTNASTVTIGAGAGPGTTIDLTTGEVTPLPASIATSGASYFATSPDHTTVAYSNCCTPGSPLTLANADGSNVRTVSEPGMDATGAQWSPDGSMLVYQQRDASTQHLGNIFVVSPGRPNIRTQLTNLDQTQNYGWWFMFPSFASDGRSVLFHMPRGDQSNPSWDLWSASVTGGEPTLVRRNAGWGDYSPDGTSIAYLSPIDANFSGAKLWIVGVHGGTPTQAVEGDLGWPRWSPDGTRISYVNGGYIYVLDVASGSRTKIAPGSNAEWADSHMLVIGPGGG